MTSRNKIKTDLILKNFWKDNDRFADLFNAYLFEGEQILKPEDFTEVDPDISSLIKLNSYAETIPKILDVVKKTANGVNFVILGIENQQKIHYAMPLRHMIGDAFSYLKEFNEIAAKNIKKKNWGSSEEFKTLVSDYKFNLIEVRKSEELKFNNQDVSTIFDITRFIYNKEYDKINHIYKKQMIPTELGLVIGAITETQKIIDDALKLEKKGEKMNMCKALEELEENGRKEGKQQGIREGEMKTKISLIQKKIQRGDSLEKIVDDLLEKIELIQPIYNIIQEHPEKTTEEIYELLNQ